MAGAPDLGNLGEPFLCSWKSAPVLGSGPSLTFRQSVTNYRRQYAWLPPDNKGGMVIRPGVLEEPGHVREPEATQAWEEGLG